MRVTLNSLITTDKPVALRFWNELGFENVGFRGEEETGRQKTSWSKDKNQQQTQNTYDDKIR